ncbi:MAG: Smr/MutS family protein [Chitinophagaceae bacterium]|nr:Smr/MutS family protein [Chitinophagaceae bacterium]
MRETQFQEGDYVRFLNEKQEGTVSKVLGNGNVIVDIENDFPIEATPKELVKVLSTTEQKASHFPTPIAVDPIPVWENYKEFPTLFASKNQLYLLVVPTQNQVSSGPVKLYLVNTTSHGIAFSLHYRKGNLLTGIHYGGIANEECKYLGEVKREKLFDYDDLQFEGTHFFSEANPSKRKISINFSLTLPDLSQAFPHLTAPLSFAKSMVLFHGDELSEENMDLLLEKLQNEHRQTPIQREEKKIIKREQGGNDLLRKHGLSPSLLEIDLHIEEITHSIEGLSNADIIQIQLAHFKKELDKCYLRQQKSIVFIHGIGNGKLKSEIRRELRESNLKFSDGSYERYGSGATEVFL